MTITSAARELQPELTRFRHAMHQEPEIGLDLPRTQEKVLRALDGLPYEITLGKETTSVTAVLRGTGGAAGNGGSRAGSAGAIGPAPRRHGRPPRPGEDRRRVHLPRGRRHARLRPRPPHGHAHRRRHVAGGEPAPPGGRRRPDVPARRGRLRRRQLHDPRRRAGRARPPRGRGLRDARVLRLGTARHLRHQTRRDAQRLRWPGGYCPRRRRPRLRPAHCQGSGDGGRRDGHGAAGDDHPPVQHVRSRGPVRRRPACRHQAERHPGDGADRGHHPDVLRSLPGRS
jgi:hypothetical protein